MSPLYPLAKAFLISRGTTTWEEHLAKKNENKEICAGIKAGNPELWGSYKNEKSAEGGVRAAIQKILGRTEQRATAAAEERNDTQPRIIPYDKCDVEGHYSYGRTLIKREVSMPHDASEKDVFEKAKELKARLVVQTGGKWYIKAFEKPTSRSGSPATSEEIEIALIKCRNSGKIYETRKSWVIYYP